MKKLISIFLVAFFTVGLAACTNEENLTEKWQNTAEESGIFITTTDGYGSSILFSSEGMKVWYSPEDANPSDIPFPFEYGKLYPDYQVIREGEKLVITAENDLSYELTIRGQRLFYDEKHKIQFTTEFYLLDEKQ